MDGQYYPTWKLVDNTYHISLSSEVARKERDPSIVVDNDLGVLYQKDVL